jgi:uracil-DNA glycosylase family 4
MTCSCGRTDGVLGFGATSAKVMFIGIAPGADEWRRTKRPLTGPSGFLLDRVLESVGINRSDVFCTNLVCFWKDAPSREEIAACSERLREEITRVGPETIVLLGKIACETMLDIPFKKARGAIIERDNRTWIATYHPAACLHRATTVVEKNLQIEAAYSLCRDLNKLADQEYIPRQPISYDVITDLEQAQSTLDSLTNQYVPMALDIETNYDKEYELAHPFDTDIVCIGVGNNDHHAYVLALRSDEWVQIKWPNTRYLYHNGVFDSQEIARHTGMFLPIREDTMLQSYSIDERSERGLHKLKSLAREMCGADFYEEDDHKIPLASDGASSSDVSGALDALYEYNAKDVVYTWRLHQALSARQDDLDKRVYRELLLPAAHILMDSQYRGIYIDQEAIREIGFLFIKEHNDLQAKLKAFCTETLGDPEFNPRSPVQVRKMLEYQGYALPNTQKATLLNLLDEVPDIPFITDLLRLRTLDKLLTSYMTDIINQIKYDGRVHPHAFLIGTVTGRLTYTKPAMQTLPKPKTVKDLGMIRKLFAATNDDYVLLEADYAQIEAWLGAYFSGDPNLLADLQSSDWHTSVAEAMFGKKKDETEVWHWAHLRDAAKHINYGSMYGEEAQGLTRRPPIGIGCDLATAKQYLSAWRQHYPTFVKYQEEQKRLAMTEPWISTPFGRKRRFPIIVNDHQLRQAVNCKIQSTASDYTLSSAIRLHEPLKALDTHLLFIEHDAIYLEVRKQYLQEVLGLLHQEMEAPPLPGLPSIRIEIEAGPNLAELEKIA